MKNEKAFTLIELLIVVAIIAILAAIAIPNLLSAQTRSKVSAAHANMRAISIGLNIYHVDTGKFIPQPDILDPMARHEAYPLLTSPISYITSIPNDPFSREEGVNRTHYYVDISKNLSINPHARIINKFIIGSNGPNGEDELVEVLKDFVDDNLAQIFESGIYDPSNGTISPGDLVRTNCAQLGGHVSERW